MKTTVLSQQSLFDIAIQAMGNAEAAFELAIVNDISVTDELTTGSLLKVPTGNENANVTMYYYSRGLKPATGMTNNEISGRIFDDTFDTSFN